MPVITEEEYKKKLEEARKLRNSVGMFTTDELNNFSENPTWSFSNNDNDYNNKLNEAKQLRNSVGFITNNDIKDPVINTNIRDDEDKITNTTENTFDKVEEQNIVNNNVINSDETENAQKPTIFEAGEFRNGYQPLDVTKTILGTATDFTQDLSKGILSTGENVLDIATNVVASVQNLLGFKEAAKGTREFANRDLSEKWSSIVANVNPIGMLFNLVNGTADKIFNPAGIKLDKNKNIIENYSNNFSKAWLEEDNEKQNYEKASIFGDYADKTANLIGYTLGMKLGTDALNELTGTKTIGSSKLGTSFSGGNIGLKLGGHTLNLSTLALTGGMAEGLQEANSKGENVSEAERWIKSFSSGTIESFTEGFFGFLGIGGNDVTEKLAQKALSKISSKAGKYLANLGISASAEAAEEFLSYIGNFMIDNGIIDKLGNADFSKKWDSSEVIESMVLAFISTGITGGATFSISTNSAIKEAENQLNRKLSNEEKNEVTKAVIDGTVDQRLGQIVGQDSIDTISEFYVTKFDQNGDVQGIVSTLGKQIENVNSKVNVKPVIVKNSQTNNYNVIDGKTGLVLDTSPYTNLMQAQAEFAHKIINLDDASINAINSKVGQANIAISNKMQQVVEQAKSILDNSQNVNTAQSQQNQFTGNLNDKTINLSNQNEKVVRAQNNKNDVTDNVDLNKYIQEMAINFQDDLANSISGQRYKTGDTWTGQKRSTTKELADIKDSTGASWNSISNVLNDIANGKENNTKLATLIKQKIDETLINGYKNIYGKNVMPNQEYVAKKSQMNGIDYSKSNVNNQEDYFDGDYRVFGMKQNNNDNNIKNNKIIVKNQKQRLPINKSLYKNDGTLKSFKEQLEDNIRNSSLVVADNSLDLIDNNYPITIAPSTIDKIIEKHDISMEELYDLPEKLKNYVLVTKSQNREDSIIVFVEQFDNQNRPIMVSIAIDKPLARLKINEITSIYGRNNAKAFITNLINDNKALKVNDKKIKNWLSSIGVQFSKELANSLFIDTSISQSNTNVNSSTNTNSMQNIENNTRIKVEKTKYTEEIKNGKYIDLTNKKVETISDLADLAQIFRNPNYETFRIIYTNGNVIVGQEALTTRSPDEVNIKSKERNRYKYYYKVNNRMERLNADGYYLIHNHPSGKAKASQSDINFTYIFDKNVKGFKGHIIINSGTYAILSKDSNGTLMQEQKNIQNYKPDEIDLMISEEPWTKIQIKSREQLVNLMYDVKNNPEYSTLVLVDAQLSPRAIIDIPNSFMNMKTEQIDGYIKNIAPKYGAIKAFIATKSKNAFEKIKTLKTIQDGILYSNNSDGLFIDEGLLETEQVKIKDIIKTKHKNTSQSDVRSMKKSNTSNSFVDNQGRQLSKQQQEFFKDSKVRDNNGNLKAVYHGTDTEFYTFNYNRLGENTSSLGAGFYFTDKKETASSYTRGTKNLKEVYIDIQKPLAYGNTTMTQTEYKNFIEAINKETNGRYLEDYGGLDEALMEYNYGGDDIDLVNAVHNASGLTWEKTYKILKETTSFDGIISEKGFLNKDETIYVAFNSNQIKNIDNTSPTINEDIRYMKRNNTQQKTQVEIDPAIQKELHNRIQNAILSSNSRKNTFLGKVTEKVVNKVKQLYGIDISGRNHILSDYDIRHMIKQHGNPTLEQSKGQIAITTKDIEKIPDILNNYNQIEKGSINNNSITGKSSNSIRYIKQYTNNAIYVVEVVPETGNTLQIKTMWKKPVKVTNNQKIPSLTSKTKLGLSSSTLEKPIGLSNDNKILPYTSETKSKLASNKIITQNNEDVNSTKKTDTQEGLTNAERADAYIEQEIRKIEKTGEWDDTIPPTKMTDIRKMIEDYLGINIKKSHFRQQAFAIYKTNRDVIRTKELNDMDSILHETGHALDLGQRIKIDKETIADELLTAIDKYGGYENETRNVKLDEGFAEIIREYAIIPEQAEAEYPQTVAVLKGIRQNNKEFNTFMTNLQKQIYNYIHQNPYNRQLSRQSIGEQTDKKPWTKERIKQSAMRAIWDKDYAIKEAVEKQAKANGKSMKDIEASKNAYYLVRLTNGIGDKITSFLADGYIDEKGQKLTPGLNQIGEILGDNPQRYNDLRVYLVAKRDVEYKAKTLKTGLRSMDTRAVLEQFKNDAQIQKAAKVIYDTLDGVLQYAVDNNLVNQDEAKSLRESNVFYVPMQRVLEDRGNQVGRRGAVSDIIKARTGSELDIKDVLENIIANSANVIQQVENNKILNALYEEGKSGGLEGNIYDIIDTPMKKIGTANLSIWEGELKRQGVDVNNLDLEKSIDLFSPNNKINVQEGITSFIDKNGKRIYLQFYDDVIFNSLMGIDSKAMSTVLKLNSAMNMPLRYGATMANIGFAIPNMISDTAQATIYSTAGFIPVIDNALGVLGVLSSTNRAVKSFIEKTAPEYAKRINYIYTLYNQTGATNSTRLSQYRQTTQNIMKNVYGTKNSEMLGINEKFKPLKRLLDLMTYIPELSEQSTRFRVFERNYNYYKNKGNSETDARIMAALEARDATQDFSRTGNVTREINQLIPFSAARVGSAYTFAEKVKANPKQIGMRIAILTALAMAIKAIGYDDKEIEELNQRKKDDNFVLKLGDKVITIKKPQGILRSMINLAEYIQDVATGHIEEGKEGEKLSEWINNAIMDNMPTDEVTGLVPNMVSPLIENAINKDFYYNTDIVKSYDLDLPDAEQYYDYNSQLAILLGQVFNYSPAKIDNLISGYFGGLGTQVTNIIDFAMSKAGLSAEKPEMGAEDNAVGKRFIVNVNTNSESLDEIYNRKTELTKKKNGGTITSEEEQELEKITSAISNISSINKQIKAIKADLTMSGDEKADAIRPLQEQKTDTARQALGKELIYEENESKIQSTQFYPSRDSLSQSGYTLELTEEMKKEYESLAYKKYRQYKKQGLYSKEKLEDLKVKCKDYAKSQLMQKYRNKLVKNK